MRATYKKPERFFIPGWVVASTIGIPIAWATFSIIEGIIGETMQVGDYTTYTEDVLLIPIFVPVLGLSTGFFQWLLLRRYLPRIGWWILATFLSFPLALAVSFVLYTFIFQAAILDSIWALGHMYIVIGGTLGFTQWLTLRKRINKAVWWILANVVGWTLFGLVIGKNVTSTLEILVAGLIPAVATGFALWLLLGQSNRGGLNEQAIVEKQITDTRDSRRNPKGIQSHTQAGAIGATGPMIRS